MTGRWDYSKQPPMPYGHKESYRRAAAFFDEVPGHVEDWGCGHAAFKPYLQKCTYRGIEGSITPEADLTGVDLRTYKSPGADHILLRHVLDHNPDWRLILRNALETFKKRCLLIFFHFWAPETKIVAINTVPWAQGVPDLVFNRADVMFLAAPYFVREEFLPADAETVNNNVLVYMEKKP